MFGAARCFQCLNDFSYALDSAFTLCKKKKTMVSRALWAFRPYFRPIQSFNLFDALYNVILSYDHHSIFFFRKVG